MSMDILETSDYFEKVVRCEKNVDSFETILLPEQPSDPHIPEEDQPSTTSLEEGELPSDELSKSSPPRGFGMSLAGSGFDMNFQTTLDAALRTPPRKPVLGKEKAKQRLKSLSNQKKIQMEGRNNVTPKSQKSNSNADLGSGGSSSSKKDKKYLSPHEKAQITINEIEVLKLEEERPKVPIYFHESMIHRITADSFDESKPNLSQPPFTSSLEAIKSYEDDENRGEERRHKLAKPEAYRRRRRSITSPLTAKRRSKSKRNKSNTRTGSLPEKRGLKSRRRSGEKRKYKSSRLSHKEDREPRKCASYVIKTGSAECDLFPESDSIRYTRTKPTITFSFNAAATKAHEAIEKSKDRKRAKKKRIRKTLPLASADEIKEALEPEGKVKSKHKKKRRLSFSKESESKGLKTKSEKQSQHKRPLLSFAIDDLNYEEEVDEFPLSKEGFLLSNESQDASGLKNALDQQAEGIRKEASIGEVELNGSGEDLCRTPPGACSLRAIDKSPDTDEYMPNWEEEEDSSKDEISLSASMTEINEEPAAGADYTIYSADLADDSSVDSSVKDGLGTPIFVNPSPPRDIIEKSLRDSDDAEDDSEQHDATVFSITPEKNTVEDVEESLTPPLIRPKHLFEMENIYEQFLQSVREDPDFKDTTTANDSLPTEFANEIELRFSSHPSLLLSPSTKTLGSGSSSSSTESSNSDVLSGLTASHEQSMTGGAVQSAKRTKKKRKRRRRKRSAAEEAVVNDASDVDEIASITPADLKKLRSLQKRRGMLKMVREQLDGMDEEDRQCLLGLEKLVRVERLMLLRNTALRKLHEKQNILGTDSEDDEKIDDGAVEVDANRISSPSKSITPPPQNCEGSDTIFDAKRETIKMTLTNNSPMKNLLTPSSKSANTTEALSADEDQDFTERLMKFKETTEKSSESKSERKYVAHRSEKRSRRCDRHLTMSPIRRSRASPSHKKKSIRSKKLARSPTPPRNTSSRRKSGQDRSRYSASPVPSRLHRLPRSPISHRASGSPTQSHSSSSRSTSPNSPALSSYSSWNINRYSQYYISDSYYYPRVVPSSDTDDKTDGSHRYPASYHDYAQYNMYANEYMHNTGYADEYSQIPLYADQHRAAPPDVTASNSYLSIPVIGAASGISTGNYFYSPDSSKISVGVSINNEILQQDDAAGSAKIFAVQKGNVLEIVPAAIITPPEGTEESETSPAVKTENVAEDENRQEGADDTSTDSSEELKSFPNIDKTKANDPEMPASQKSHHSSWKNEVARRHVVSAVMRLNKEAEESPRGILKNRGNSNLSAKERKKVLFADGVPPGRNSSASSDDEATLKLIRRQLKRKQRRMQSENKENEMFVESVDNLEAKIDPELWNALPPPPPPGSPPPHLPQPILIRPSSPEEALYFHFDPVFNMMYVSPMEDAIPPRLLQNNGKSMVKHNVDNTTGTENGDLGSENSIPDKLEPPSPTRPASPIKKEDVNITILDDTGPKSSRSPEPMKLVASTPPSITQESNNSTALIPAPPPPTTSSPPRPIQNIVSMRMSNNSPLFSCTSPQAGMSPTTLSPYEPAHQQSPSQMPPTCGPRPPIQVLVGYSGQMFGRMPSRRSSPRMMRGAYNMLAMPPPHSRAFNPRMPPPFTSPPPAPNHNGSLPPPASTFDNSALNVFPHSPLSNSPQVPQQQYNPGMMMYNTPQPPRPSNFRYTGIGPPQAPPPPVTLNPLPNRFPTNFPPPVPMMGFMHGPPDRIDSPRKLND